MRVSVPISEGGGQVSACIPLAVLLATLAHEPTSEIPFASGPVTGAEAIVTITVNPATRAWTFVVAAPNEEGKVCAHVILAGEHFQPGLPAALAGTDISDHR